MPRPTDHRKYPKVFELVLDKMKESDEPVVLKYPTLAKARSFRLDFYSYAAAMTRDEEAMRAVNYGPFLHAIQIQVRDDPPRAILIKKDVGEMARDTEAALAALEDSTDTKVKKIAGIIQHVVESSGLAPDSNAVRRIVYRNFFFRTMLAKEFSELYPQALAFLSGGPDA